MRALLNALFDFHPKEQKGILTLGILLVVITLGHALHHRMTASVSMEAAIPPETIDSLHAAYHRLVPVYSSEEDTVDRGSDETSNPVAETPAPAQYSYANRPYGADRSYPQWKKPEVPALLDINAADSVTWLTVRGIGPYTAKKIIAFRDKLGGFHSTEQLREIYKIDPTVFDTCGTRFTCQSNDVNKININTCTLTELASHPYLNKSQAKSIIAYREMHGLYSSLQALERVVLIDAITRNKITPYLTTE